ncbi:MAG: (2Fe-2S)-binding protein [Deltaproteobacteria bacterium]|nr:(2Fe-2S)-binding protein [Deltaproteobacteria bacterium]MBW2385228.1 (2Fe-2S)-binding protein [Deltaproteobacteria bacterium]
MIRFVPAEREVRVPSGTSLLEAARLAGLPVARSCVGEATCARCGLQILAGGEALPPESEGERRVKQRNRIDAELRLACQLRLDRDLTVTAPYW